MLHSRISDVGNGDEELEGVLLVGLTDTALNIALDLGLTLLAVAGVSCSRSTDSLRSESQLLLVAPENIWSGGHTGLRQQEVQVDDLGILDLHQHTHLGN